MDTVVVAEDLESRYGSTNDASIFRVPNLMGWTTIYDPLFTAFNTLKYSLGNWILTFTLVPILMDWLWLKENVHRNIIKIIISYKHEVLTC